jgi:type I restriction enzyme S subunit
MRENAAQARKRSTGLRRALLDAAFTGRLAGRSVDTEIVEELAEVAS